VLHVVRDRIVDLLPQTVTIRGIEWALKRDEALNGRWRWNRYAMGQKFAPHFDAGYTRNKNEMTQLTYVYFYTILMMIRFIAYLNGEEIDGGETIFFPGGKKFSYHPENSAQEVRIKPETGKAIVFLQVSCKTCLFND
jgi:hypothetical protein